VPQVAEDLLAAGVEHSLWELVADTRIESHSDQTALIVVIAGFIGSCARPMLTIPELVMGSEPRTLAEQQARVAARSWYSHAALELCAERPTQSTQR
jgi:hypothetical protein